jgi:N6-L-threonylcarbamoyladenine synthase
MEGHIFSVLYGATEPLELPALALLVSGGHTELVKISGFRDYDILGRTRDDAVGEAFDKVARMLSLPYPGGPIISKLAKEAREQGLEPGFDLPRPMIHSGNLDFSFSGLKTAVLYKVRDLNINDGETRKRVARAFEDACIDVLTEKTRQALEKESGIKTLILAGGVSANSHLRQKLSTLAEEADVKFLLPEVSLSTDNALMIGIAAFIRNEKEPMSSPSSPIQAKGNLSLEG